MSVRVLRDALRGALRCAAALALACGPTAGPTPRAEAGSSDSGPPTPTPAIPGVAAPTIAEACRGAGQFGAAEIAAIPDDLRLAAVLDRRADDLPAALERLEAWAREEAPRIPVVVAMPLQQLGFQSRWIAELLGGRGLALDAFALLIAPGGESIWIWQIACDLGPLRRALEAWGLQIRALAAGGLVAEPRDPSVFPFDLVITSGDRMALVPAGAGVGLLRWLGGAGAAADLGAAEGQETAADLLAGLAPAALRIVIADHTRRGIALTPSGEAPRTRGLRVTGAILEVDGSVPP